MNKEMRDLFKAIGCTKREVGPFEYIHIANNIGNFTIDMCSELHRNGRDQEIEVPG